MIKSRNCSEHPQDKAATPACDCEYRTILVRFSPCLRPLLPDMMAGRGEMPGELIWHSKDLVN
jgi:hypothetical protein